MNIELETIKKFQQKNYEIIYLISTENADHKNLLHQHLNLPSDFESLENDSFQVSTLSFNPRQIMVEINLPEALNARESIRLGKKAVSLMNDEKLENASLLFLDENHTNNHIQFLKSFKLNQAGFDKYRNQKQSAKHCTVYSVHDGFLNDFETVKGLSDTISFTKMLVNEPANFLTPTALATLSQDFSLANGIEVEIKGQKDIESLKMDAFLSVARGSIQEPKLIILRYLNNPESDEITALVGKGVTYDSGGYAIKPATGMVTMHCDMGGSASVIGAINLLAKQKEKVNVIAVVAACENMISGDAFKNGDIINSMSGKTIEIINTDAEGRLTLADAIWYAHSVEKATKIVDIATLTGAVFAALGKNITGVVSNDDQFYQSLEHASKLSGDKIWRLPCDDDLAKCNHSKRADIKNASACGAGTTTAGLFLKEFTNDIPWTHLDIAFTAYHDGDDYNPEGATGVGVELLANAVIHSFNQ
ncbi:leucyl aminopeptidase [Erysipelothrix urinaevulpis]|uniref:leucyl aminopeptidase n=1 Tax=Erysipelothrix urinaevulpis TaxID=2683717 RepID=UPI00135972DC|nr:leucyl aminopeptidase [Erysipelothrix urinaevulpis]